MWDELREQFEDWWEPVPRWALLSWLVVYALFLVHALLDEDGFLLIDNANLIVHEAGHLLFGWTGVEFLTAAGGTLLQLFVPLALAGHFALQRQATWVVFALFFFFENFLNIGRYMADARAQALPLVTVGDPEMAQHDWFYLFSQLGLLRYDTLIGGLTRALGWLGMLGSVAWLLLHSRAQAEQSER